MDRYFPDSLHIQQTVKAGSKRCGITTERDTEDNNLHIIQLAVF